MKCSIPEISWHNRDPILSVDIQNNSTEKFVRLASAGADNHILIWQLSLDETGKCSFEAISDLTRHQRPVNIVRWSPSGEYLASGDDDANIIVWQLKTDNIPLLDGETNDKETWIVYKILRGHKEDVYDICWSPDSCKLVSGSIDNSAIVWNLKSGKNEHIFGESKGFVQGVTWDPKNQLISTLSSDRVCRTIDYAKRQIIAKSFKGFLPVPEKHLLHNKEVKYFHDDTFKSFFRRLTFSPDGNLLVTPSGCIEHEDCRKYLSSTYIYSVDCLTKPSVILPLVKQNSVAVRFCPVFFHLRSDGPKPYIDLPYRMIFAVATESDVILYDTQQSTPFAVLQKVHYTRLTDLTWSPDGSILLASSTDGFCTIVTFENGELGTTYELKEVEPEPEVVAPDAPEVQEKKKEMPGKDKINVLKVKRKKGDDKGEKRNTLFSWAWKGGGSGKEEETGGVGGGNTVQKCDLLEKSERKKDVSDGNSCDSDCIVVETEDGKGGRNEVEDVVFKESQKRINVLQVKRKEIDENNSDKIEIKKQKLDESEKTDNKEKVKINVLQVKRKPTANTDEKMKVLNEEKHVEDKNPKITISEKVESNNSSEVENIEMKDFKKEEETCLGKDKNKVNVLQVRRKKKDQLDSVDKEKNHVSELKIDNEMEDVKKPKEKINILQVKRKNKDGVIVSSQETKKDGESAAIKRKSKGLDSWRIKNVSLSSNKVDHKSPKVQINKSKKELVMTSLNDEERENKDNNSKDDENKQTKQNLKNKKNDTGTKKDKTPKKPTILDQWAIKKPKNN